MHPFYKMDTIGTKVVVDTRGLVMGLSRNVVIVFLSALCVFWRRGELTACPLRIFCG